MIIVHAGQHVLQRVAVLDDTVGSISGKDMGISVEEKLPKKDRRKAAYEVFILPVRPTIAGMNFGSRSARLKNSFRGERKTNASVG